jgi:RNA polymerase sigma factor (sigma-70 family)
VVLRLPSSVRAVDWLVPRYFLAAYIDGTAPVELKQLLHAPDAGTREAAWEELVARHSRLLLSIARSFGGGQDQAMERYTYILEKLYEANYRRLRVYHSDGQARFSTWLTVTARRLCLDHHRTHYGRARACSVPNQTESLRSIRRALIDSLGDGIDTDLVSDSDAATAESRTIRQDRDARLHAELAALPAQDRLLLALRFEDDLSASRIAGVLGFPTAFHVYRRLKALLARLRAVLTSHGIEGSDG